ncbi:MAG: permease, partial [Gammaproteobacteria bacterium]
LGMVFLLLYIANLLLTPSTVKRYLGKEAGIKGWIASIVAGIFSMGPIYAWYTALAELQQKGMRTALVATFLYSRAVKIPLLPLMIYYFGPGYTIVLCLYLLVFSVVNGFLTERLMHHKT